MTITLTKKHAFIGIGVLAVFAIIYGLTRIDGFDYESTAKEAKINMKMLSMVSTEILGDYSENWRSAIHDDRAYNVEGEKRWCSDFNEAISWRYLHYKKRGYFAVFDSISNRIKENLTDLDKHSSNHKEEQSLLVQLYNSSSSLYSLTKDPKGSLFSFNQRVNDLAMEFESKYKETDIKIPVSDDELKNKFSEITNSLVSKAIDVACEELKAKSQLYEPNKKAGEDFLANNAKKEGVRMFPSGVQYKIFKEGHGAIPKETSRVRVYYKGTLVDGTVFDSNMDDSPTTFRVNQVIPGFKEALMNMPVGSEWEVYIPYKYAYGEEDMGNIQPYSALIFRINLLGIEP